LDIRRFSAMRGEAWGNFGYRVSLSPPPCLLRSVPVLSRWGGSTAGDLRKNALPVRLERAPRCCCGRDRGCVPEWWVSWSDRVRPPCRTRSWTRWRYSNFNCCRSDIVERTQGVAPALTAYHEKERAPHRPGDASPDASSKRARWPGWIKRNANPPSRKEKPGVRQPRRAISVRKKRIVPLVQSCNCGLWPKPGIFGLMCTRFDRYALRADPGYGTSNSWVSWSSWSSSKASLAWPVIETAIGMSG
jgi:hypothetical protein